MGEVIEMAVRTAKRHKHDKFVLEPSNRRYWTAVVGHNLRMYRTAQFMTQLTLAQRVTDLGYKIDYTQICRIERLGMTGRYTPGQSQSVDVDLLVRAAMVLGVQVSDLLRL